MAYICRSGLQQRPPNITDENRPSITIGKHMVRQTTIAENRFDVVPPNVVPEFGWGQIGATIIGRKDEPRWKSGIA
ncbi:hypothetical protein ZHAS_00013997 [Anopheles sinensis]|uniref:Uncharacterized protein n=1 Tax=Anopheles sinensis TaxID=74873 RepID=A0A084W6Y0_ANOSI|nr:hypothetical protein ZHAS_00013997 [Anopheles sinensis]